VNYEIRSKNRNVDHLTTKMNFMIEIIIYLVQNLSNKMIYRNLAKELNKNLAYRLSNIVSELFRGFLVRPRNRHKGKYKKYYLEKLQYRLVLNDN